MPARIVIVGRSLSGLVLSAGLSQLGHRVTLVSLTKPPSAQLINGCTLRHAALTTLADILHTSIDALLERFGREAVFHHLSSRRGDQVFSCQTPEVGGVSTRHQRLLDVLFELVPSFCDIEHIDADVARGGAFDGRELPLTKGVLALDPGSIVLNASPFADLLRPNAVDPIDGYVHAQQVALRAPNDAPLVGRNRASLLVHEGARPQAMLFAPFFDPQNPDANAYAFWGTSSATAEPPVLAWRQYAGEQGIEVIESSLTDVQLPFFRGSTPKRDDGVVDVRFRCGAPGVNLDGMTAQTAAAHAFVRAFGNDDALANAAKRASAAAERALSPLRRANRASVWLHSSSGRHVRNAIYDFGSNKTLAWFNSQSNALGQLSARDATKTGVLTQIGPDIWTMRQLQATGALHFSSRMTVVRLADGSLFVHSPVFGGIEAVKRLGVVRHLVAPNLFHHRALATYRAAFADATVWVPPGFDRKLPQQAAGTSVLDDSAPVDPALRQLLVRGHSVNETAFLHRASKTLLLADLAYHVGDEATGFERLWFRSTGVLASGRVPKYNRALVTEEKAFVAAYRELLSWEVDQVSVGHGRLMRHEPKQLLRAQWRPIAL